MNPDLEQIGVLATDDKLYYVIFGDTPDVIKEKAIKKAESLKSKLESQLEDAEKWKKLDLHFNSFLDFYINHYNVFSDRKKLFETNQNLESQIKQLQERLENNTIELVNVNNGLENELVHFKAVVDEINELIEMYEHLNIRHTESYNETCDTSLLNTISRNQEHIEELKVILSKLEKKS